MEAEDRENPPAAAPALQSKATNHMGSEAYAVPPTLPTSATNDFTSDEGIAREQAADDFHAPDQTGPAVNDPPVAEHTVAIPALGERGFGDLPGKDHQVKMPSSDDLPIDSSVVVKNSLVLAESPGAIRRGLLDLQVKLRFHRADLYLGIAIVVAFFALLFPATATQRSALRPWERMLIAMGIAEAPEPAVHYRGDPDIKVWVDTHTALYYCPGSEPYGKSPDGHYSTQREAQSDHFEPAERVVCVD